MEAKALPSSTVARWRDAARLGRPSQELFEGYQVAVLAFEPLGLLACGDERKHPLQATFKEP